MTLFLRSSAPLRPSTPTGSHCSRRSARSNKSHSSRRSARSNKSRRMPTGSNKKSSGFSFRKGRRANNDRADNSGVRRSAVVPNTAAPESDFFGDLEAEIKAMRDPPPQINVRTIECDAKPAVFRRGRGDQSRNTSSRRQNATQPKTCSTLDFLDSWEFFLINCSACGMNETVTDFIFPVDGSDICKWNGQGERNGRQNDGLMQHSTRNHHMSIGKADHSMNCHNDTDESSRMVYDV